MIDLGDVVGFFAGALFASLFWLSWISLAEEDLEQHDRDRTTDVQR